MIADLKFYDQLYVGFSKRSGNTEDDLLGFATPDGDDKAAEKRKATVDGWRTKDIEPKIVKNEPRMGFKILESRRRYRGNKVFRVYDPAGFELEISAENLCDLIDRSIINKGDILDQLVWGRLGSVNYLIPSSSEEYKTHLRGPIKFELEPGVFLINKTKTIAYRYEGKFNFRFVTIRDYDIYKDRQGNKTSQQYDGRYYGYTYGRGANEHIGRELSYELSKPKQAHVYSIISLSQTEDTDGTLIFEEKGTNYHKKTYYETSSAPIKNLVPMTELLLTAQQEQVKDIFKERCPVVVAGSRLDKDAVDSNSMGYGGGTVFFFGSPKEAREFSPTDEEIIATYPHDYTERYDYQTRSYVRYKDINSRVVIRD